MRLCHSSFGSRQYGPQLVNREGTALENFAILGRLYRCFSGVLQQEAVSAS
jgi:hypothetical protein